MNSWGNMTAKVDDLEKDLLELLHSFETDGGRQVKRIIITSYPYDGEVYFTLKTDVAKLDGDEWHDTKRHVHREK